MSHGMTLGGPNNATGYQVGGVQVVGAQQATIADMVLAGSLVGHMYLANVATASTTNAGDQLDVEGASGSETVANLVQPDVSRCLTITVTDGGVEISAFQIDVVGKAPDGSAATEQFVFAGGLVQVGTTVFAELTSITLTSITETGATAKTLDTGWNTSIGVPVPAASTGLTITHVDAAGTEEAAASVDATNNSFVFTTAPDGTKDFTVTFEYINPTITELITKFETLLGHLETHGLLASS